MNDSDNFTTKVKFAGTEKVIKGKALSDASLWPIVLDCSEIGIQAEVSVDRDIQNFTVKVNNVPYNDLPYTPVNIGEAGESEVPVLLGDVKLNRITVIDSSAPIIFRPSAFRAAIADKLGDQKLKSVAVSDITCASSTVNTLIDLLCSLVDDEEGLEELTF